MASTILLKSSATTSKVPTTSTLSLRELAINTTDGRLFFRQGTGVVGDSILEVATLTGIQTLSNKTASGLTLTGTLTAGGGVGSSGQFLQSTGTGVQWANATISNSVTFNNSGTGGVSGSAFNGSAALTVSYNTIGASPLAGSSSLTTTGTITSGTWSASFGAVSGANLINLTAGNLIGTIPSGVLGNSTLYVGTTAIALNRASASQALTGISSIDGSAATLTTTRTLWGQNFNGGANVTGDLSSVGNITGTGAVNLTATGATLGLVATGANIITATTNATERLRINSSGNVGIGTASPAGRLDVSTFSSSPETSEFGAIFNLGSTTPTSNRYIKISQAFTGSAFDGFPIVWETNANASNQKAYGYIQTLADGSITLGNKVAGSAVAIGTALGASERLRIDSSGNLGLGVVPSAWGSSYRSISLGASKATISTNINFGGVTLSSNAFNNGTNWIYDFNNGSTRYDLYNGQHSWYTAPSGTAGNAISFAQAMTLDASGNLLVGNTSTIPSNASGTIQVNGPGNSQDPAINAQQFVICNNPYNGTATSGISFWNKYNSSGTYAGMGGIAVGKENTIDGNYSSVLTLYTRTNGSSVAERLRIDSSGNLGLGVVPVSSQGRSFQFGGAGALENEAINTNDWRTNLTSNAISVTPYSNSYKYLVSSASATMYQQAGGQHRWFTAGTGTAGNAISFTQAMTLDASSNLTVTGSVTATTFSGSGASLTSLNASNLSSGTVPTARLASGTANSTTFLRGDQTWATVSSGVTVSDDTSTNATRYVVFEDVTSGSSSTVGVSSTKLTFNPSTGNLVVGGTVTANSDISLKKNIKTISGALDKTLSLRGVEFDFIESNEHQIGVIAQEVENILPELVKENSEGLKSVAYQNMVAILIEAIKEQNELISSLSSRLDKLEFKE